LGEQSVWVKASLGLLVLLVDGPIGLAGDRERATEVVVGTADIARRELAGDVQLSRRQWNIPALAGAQSF